MSSLFIWYFSRAAGAVALLLLAIATIIGILGTAPRWGAQRRAFVQRMHRSFTGIAVVFLALHILTVVVDSYVSVSPLAVLVPFTSAYSTFWVALGTVAVDLLIAITFSSLMRRKLRHTTWRYLHLSAYALFPIGAIHAIAVKGSDPSQPWMLGIFGFGIVGILGAAVVCYAQRSKTADFQHRAAATARFDEVRR